MPSLYRSIIFAITAGIISSVLGILLSYYTHRRKIPFMKYMEFVSSLPYIIPGIFFGLGYVVAFNNKPLLLTGTTAIVILNSTLKYHKIEFHFTINIFWCMKMTYIIYSSIELFISQCKKCKRKQFCADYEMLK